MKSGHFYLFSEAVETLQSANNVFSRVGVSNESVETAAKLPTNILSSLDLGRMETQSERKSCSTIIYFLTLRFRFYDLRIGRLVVYWRKRLVLKR